MINWSPLDNLHITTKFIGEWPEARLPEIRSVLSGIINREPFDLEIRELGWFPNERTPRVLRMGVHDGGAFPQLARDMEDRLADIGVKREARDFFPHLTLARIKGRVPLERLHQKVEEMQPAAVGAFRVDRFALFRSHPGSNASIYRKLEEYVLQPSMAGVAVAQQ
jgi:2'-5' RNA ligase